MGDDWSEMGQWGGGGRGLQVLGGVQTGLCPVLIECCINFLCTPLYCINCVYCIV